LHSPGPIDDADAAAIASIAPVTALIAPNLMHHLYLAPARRRFPEARLIAPERLKDKRPDLTVDVPLSVSEPARNRTLLGPELLSVLTPLPVAGMPKLDEIAWLHRGARTLILGDLAFNIRPPAPWFTRLFMRWNGGFDRFGP